MNILAVAGDAGGARALAPVIRRLLEVDGVTVRCLAYAAAVEIWEAGGFQPREMKPVNVTEFDRILLGTTVGKEQWELRFILHARQQQVPTVSILDFWTHYRERFTSDDGEFILPEAIAVMDEQAKEEMVAIGFPVNRLLVTGHPGFDELGRYNSPEFRRQALGRVRRLAGCGVNDLCVLYVSQPLSQLWAAETLGFHEREVLPVVVEALAAVLRRRSRRACLLIKRHPRESERDFRPPVSMSARLKIGVVEGAQADPLELVVGSDLVIGMSSMLLMEACLLRRPVISYQPNLQVPDPLPVNRCGWSRAVYSPCRLDEALDAELFDDDTRRERKGRLREITLPGGATERVIALLGVPNAKMAAAGNILRTSGT